MRVHFLGDEVSAVGFRLAGAEIAMPPPDSVWDQVEISRTQCDLLLMTARVASHLQEEQRQELMRSHQPLVLIIPDVREKQMPDDVIEPIRRRLGIREGLFSTET